MYNIHIYIYAGGAFSAFACHRRVRVFCRMWNVEVGELSRGNLQKIKCGMFCKLPLIAFPHSAAEKFRISADCKTAVRSHCTTDVQPMHSSVRRPAVPSFRILVDPSVSSRFQVSHHFAGRCVCIIGATVAQTIARNKRLICAILCNSCGMTAAVTIAVVTNRHDDRIMQTLVSDIAIFVLKRDVKLQLTNIMQTSCNRRDKNSGRILRLSSRMLSCLYMSCRPTCIRYVQLSSDNMI